MENVLEKVCEEKHRAIAEHDKVVDNRLNDHAGRIKNVEQALVVLTEMQKSQARRDVFDKILVVSMFITILVVAAMVLGPEITGKMIGGIK